MDQGLLGLLVLIGLSIGSALFFHIKVKRFWTASLLAALTASVIIQINGYLVLGSLEPFFMIALVTGGILSLVVAVLVGLVIHYFRKMRTPDDTKRQ